MILNMRYPLMLFPCTLYHKTFFFLQNGANPEKADEKSRKAAAAEAEAEKQRKERKAAQELFALRSASSVCVC